MHNFSPPPATPAFLGCAACRILVPWPGMESLPPAVEVGNLNYWTAREIPMHNPLSLGPMRSMMMKRLGSMEGFIRQNMGALSNPQTHPQLLAPITPSWSFLFAWAGSPRGSLVWWWFLTILGGHRVLAFDWPVPSKYSKNHGDGTSVGNTPWETEWMSADDEWKDCIHFLWLSFRWLQTWWFPTVRMYCPTVCRSSLTQASLNSIKMSARLHPFRRLVRAGEWVMGEESVFLPFLASGGSHIPWLVARLSSDIACL